MSRRWNILVVLVQILILSQLPAFAGSSVASAATDARLTEAHGNVYKRTFTDWTKEALGDPTPAMAGEVMHEGMQVGTGEKSWAQLQWRHVSARAWANSVYAISPNQRLVYLIGGEMLYQLDKNRHDHSPYYVWTNLLQARIRGTTVVFQATKTKSRITVLEGTVEVLNKVDRSVVTITPGTVYEISAKPSAPAEPETDSLTNFSVPTANATPIFETSKTSASVTPIDPMVVMNHPLLRDFEAPLSSLPLITDAMSSIQARLENAGKNLTGALTQILHDSLTITSVPRALNYSIGQDIRNVSQVIPGVFDFFSPEGIVGKRAIAMPEKAVPGASLPGQLMNNGALTALTAQSTLQPTAALTNIGATVNGAASLANAQTTALTGSAGVLGGTTSLVSSTLGGVSGVVGGTVSSVGGIVGGTVGGVGGIVGGTVGGVGGIVGGTVGGVGGIVGGTLNGLFGH